MYFLNTISTYSPQEIFNKKNGIKIGYYNKDTIFVRTIKNIFYEKGDKIQFGVP